MHAGMFFGLLKLSPVEVDYSQSAEIGSGQHGSWGSR